MENNFKKYFKMIFIIAVIFGIFVAIYFIYKHYTEKDEYAEVEKYDANEVLPIYITEDQMAKIYFSDYTNYLYSNINKAYDLLNSEYREKKFGSIQNFQNYINTIDLNSLDMKKFAIKDSGGYEYFYIYDNSDRLYIFKTKGVMQYEVYLDETTVNV